ncbi:MAG TPA: hypothetical protein VM578_11650 [Candidatus Saccharimonadales bacterium]|nr:hypothetical protein [Candidatus Saccharimonadales bacterium]
MTILAHKLMRLIETHSESLVKKLEAKIANSDRCTDYKRVPPAELENLVGGVYGHLSEWLSTRTEEEIERRYTAVGRRRAEQSVAVSQLVWCFVLVKENLWEYLRENENRETTAQIFGELELTQMVEQFFDRAIYYAVRGHEGIGQEHLAAGK